MMKVLICGSRDWEDRNVVLNRVSELWREHGSNVEIIEGGARGADSMARAGARMFKLKLTTVQADWDDFGAAAGPIRNREMLDMGPDLVLAFQRGDSRGTQDTIDEARKRGIPVEVVSD